MPSRRPTLAGGALVVVVLAMIVAPFAHAVDWRKEEARYKRVYPEFMRIALPHVPYRNALLRMMYFGGGVGTYYSKPPDRAPLCRSARSDVAAFTRAAKRQLFGSPDSALMARQAGVTQAQVISAYRRGVLFSCALRS